MLKNQVDLLGISYVLRPGKPALEVGTYPCRLDERTFQFPLQTATPSSSITRLLLLLNRLARNIKNRGRPQPLPNNPKTRHRPPPARVPQDIPPHILPPKQRAPDLVPKPLRFLRRRHRLPGRLPADRETRLRDPHRPPAHPRPRLGQCILEQRPPPLQPVRHQALPVAVRVHAHPVHRVDNRLVRRVRPLRPRVHVADRHAREPGSLDGVTRALDVPHERRRVGPRAGAVGFPRRRAAVEVLGADRDADDEVGEGLAVGGDSRGEGGEFAGDAGFAGGGPEAEEEGRVGGDGRGDGADRGGRGSPLLGSPC